MHTENVYPVIQEFKTSETFKFLWLKYVKGFDLSKHCARCLLGEYSKIFPFGFTKGIELKNRPIDEYEAEYYYLCGVTHPYRWNNNLHIAFRAKRGETLEYNDGKTYIKIENAERIAIVSRESYLLHEKGINPAYYTCRNWQFAYQITNELNN